MKISIRRLDAMPSDGEEHEAKPFLYVVQQGTLAMGQFMVEDYDDAEKAHQAARELAAKLETSPWVSPFAKHRDLLTLADYSTAQRLASLCLNLYNGAAYPCDLGSFFSNSDSKHREIAFELMASYAQMGENDRDFMAVCEEIRAQREAARREREQEGDE